MTAMPSIAVLISGRGSNLAALLAADRAGHLGGQIRLVISNREEAAGLVHARAEGIETLVLSGRERATTDEYDRALVAELHARRVALVCLAGFMRLLGPRICEAFERRMLNIHPSLLPAFPGTGAQRQALEHGVKVSGATVHFVTPELDAGPIVLQAPVPVEDDDTVESLSARILELEHRLYPEAVRRLLCRRWHLDGRRVVFDDVRASMRD